MIWRLLRKLFPPPPDRRIDALISPPRYCCRLTGESFRLYDPLLRERTMRRRESADAIRVRAMRIETGESTPANVLRSMRRA